jgi:3',5'-cyclic AMP phosphodiesterase CpdA
MVRRHFVGFRFCVAALAFSCAASRGMHVHPTAGWNVANTTPLQENGPNGLPDAADFLVVADTHASYPEAPHDLHTDNYYADSVIGAAVRPPQMDFWGTRVFAWLLPLVPVKAVIHLGDVANISCEYEFDRFADEINRFSLAKSIPWFLTPGNHDSLLMGNWAYELPLEEVDTRWGRECGAARAMDKKLLIEKYLQAKEWNETGRNAALSDSNYTCSDINTARDSPSLKPTPAVTASAILCRRVPPSGAPRGYEWGDFLVQVVAMGEKTIVLMDSTDFRKRPGVWHMGGIWGGVSGKQIEAIKLLVKGRKTSSLLIGTHYPLDTLDEASQIAVQDLISSTLPIAVFTAHTHFPTAVRRHTFSASDGYYLEVNVASVVGWPMEFSYLTLPAEPKPSLKLTVASAARILAGSPTSECSLWMTSNLFDESSYEYYTHYRRPHGYARLLRNMFAIERTTIAGVSTSLFHSEMSTPDVKEALRRDGVLPANVDTVAAQVDLYERCQAVFASAADDGDKLTFHRLEAAESGSPSYGAFTPDPPAEEPQSPIRASTETAHTVEWTFVPTSPPGPLSQ